jgi:SAM-dependent methyltransferase
LPAPDDGLPHGLPFSPAAERNQAPILEQLCAWLPAHARVLEIASGTGQHAAHFGAACPGWRWHPTEADAQALAPIALRCAGLAAVQAPVVLDVRQPDWLAPAPGASDARGRAPAGDGFDAIYVANLLHISPWACTAALMQGAARLLRPGGQLCVYGPFIVAGVATAASNLAFDADLRKRDADWGLRDLGAVQAAAAAQGLEWVERVALPANNLLLRWRRGGA